jgi:hypothetical protein
MLSVVMLSVTLTYSHAECHHAAFYYAFFTKNVIKLSVTMLSIVAPGDVKLGQKTRLGIGRFK